MWETGKRGDQRRKTMSGRVHSRELKMTVVRQLASGEKRPAQICREHNLASSVVSRWRNEYEQRGEEAFLPPSSSEGPSAEARIAELERFCGQLALENTLLKKAEWQTSLEQVNFESSQISCRIFSKAPLLPARFLPLP